MSDAIYPYYHLLMKVANPSNFESYQLQQVVKLPESNNVTASQDLGAKKLGKEQPPGLKMRYHPSGINNRTVNDSQTLLGSDLDTLNRGTFSEAAGLTIPTKKRKKRTEHDDEQSKLSKKHKRKDESSQSQQIAAKSPEATPEAGDATSPPKKKKKRSKDEKHDRERADDLAQEGNAEAIESSKPHDNDEKHSKSAPEPSTEMTEPVATEPEKKKKKKKKKKKAEAIE